jgi:hypothetical protein
MKRLLFFIFTTFIGLVTNLISNNIEKIDTCLIGLTIKQAINNLKIDTSQFTIALEDASYYGLNITIIDSISIPHTVTQIVLHTEQISATSCINRNFKLLYLCLIDKIITRVDWYKKNEQGSITEGHVFK